MNDNNEELRAAFNNCTRIDFAIEVDLMGSLLAAVDEARSLSEQGGFIRFPVFAAPGGKKICVQVREFSATNGEVVFRLGDSGQECPKIP